MSSRSGCLESPPPPHIQPSPNFGASSGPCLSLPSPRQQQAAAEAVLGHLVAISSFYYSWRRHMGEGMEPALVVQDCKGMGRGWHSVGLGMRRGERVCLQPHVPLVGAQCVSGVRGDGVGEPHSHFPSEPPCATKTRAKNVWFWGAETMEKTLRCRAAGTESSSDGFQCLRLSLSGEALPPEETKLLLLQRHKAGIHTAGIPGWHERGMEAGSPAVTTLHRMTLHRRRIVSSLKIAVLCSGRVSWPLVLLFLGNPTRVGASWGPAVSSHPRSRGMLGGYLLSRWSSRPSAPWSLWQKGAKSHPRACPIAGGAGCSLLPHVLA